MIRIKFNTIRFFLSGLESLPDYTPVKAIVFETESGSHPKASITPHDVYDPILCLELPSEKNK